MKKVWVDYSTYFFPMILNSKLATKFNPFQAYSCLEGLFAPTFANFWRHPRWQLYENMSTGHKKSQENVHSQFKHFSNEWKKFGLIIRQTFVSMVLNSKLATKNKGSLHRTVMCLLMLFSDLKKFRNFLPFSPHTHKGK